MHILATLEPLVSTVIEFTVYSVNLTVPKVAKYIMGHNILLACDSVTVSGCVQYFVF